VQIQEQNSAVVKIPLANL